MLLFWPFWGGWATFYPAPSRGNPWDFPGLLSVTQKGFLPCYTKNLLHLLSPRSCFTSFEVCGSFRCSWLYLAGQRIPCDLFSCWSTWQGDQSQFLDSDSCKERLFSLSEHPTLKPDWIRVGSSGSTADPGSVCPKSHISACPELQSWDSAWAPAWILLISLGKFQAHC